jgi:hypothetical protein
MRTLQLALGVDLDFPNTNGAAIDMSTQDLPFQPGGSAICVCSVNNWAEAEAVGKLTVQGSDNAFSGWEDLAHAGGGVTGCPVSYTEIVIPDWIRVISNGATAGDGRGSAYLLQN